MNLDGIRRIAIAAVAALALSAIPLSTLAGSGTVTGTLINDDTGGVAAGIDVSACGSSGCVSNGHSDANGRYRLRLPSGNGWNVFTEAGDCGATGYARSHKYGVNVIDGGDLTVDLHLTKQRGAISGRVLDQSGASVGGVSLVVDNAETGGFGLSSTTSGGDGTYTVRCLAAAGVAGAGTYYITAFPPASSPYGQQQDAGIGVHGGAITSHDVILKRGGGIITGRVTCGGATCPATVSILVYCEGCTSAATTQTDPNGAFLTGRLQAGNKYDVHAVAPAGWDNAIHYGVAINDGGRTTIGLDLVRSGPGSSGSLTGRVSDAAGAAHGQCLINAFGGVPGTSAGGWTDGDVHTGDDGSFDTGFQLVPGDYLVFLVCPGWPQVQLYGGRAIAVRAGAAADASYVFPERGRPFVGGHVVVGAAATSEAFFAAGSTAFSASSISRETISVSNPGEAQPLAVTYLINGSQPSTRIYPLPDHGLTTINVNVDVGPNQEVSAWLTAANPFVAERSMYVLSAEGISGGTDVMGVSGLNRSWYFAEGSTGPGFTETLTLLNPNLGQDASAAVTYFLAAGQSKTVLRAVPAFGRLSLNVNDAKEAGGSPAVAISVVADLPILAERSMAFQFGSIRGMHTAVGAPAPATTLNLAEGHVGGGFDEYLALLNPNDDNATATITYVVPGSSPTQQTVTLAGAARTTLHVNGLVPGNVDCSIRIESDLPITAERVSYFALPGSGWSGGNATVGVPDGALSREVSFAGHAAGSHSLDYVSVFNPGPDAGVVTFSYPAAGGPVIKTVTVAGLSRVTQAASADAPGQQGAATVTSTVPVLVERASYFAY